MVFAHFRIGTRKSDRPSAQIEKLTYSVRKFKYIAPLPPPGASPTSPARTECHHSPVLHTSTAFLHVSKQQPTMWSYQGLVAEEVALLLLPLLALRRTAVYLPHLLHLR